MILGYWSVDDLQAAKCLVRKIANQAGTQGGSLTERQMQEAIGEALRIMSVVRSHKPSELELPL